MRIGRSSSWLLNHDEKNDFLLDFDLERELVRAGRRVVPDEVRAVLESSAHGMSVCFVLEYRFLVVPFIFSHIDGSFGLVRAVEVAVADPSDGSENLGKLGLGSEGSLGIEGHAKPPVSLSPVLAFAEGASSPLAKGFNLDKVDSCSSAPTTGTQIKPRQTSQINRYIASLHPKGNVQRGQGCSKEDIASEKSGGECGKRTVSCPDGIRAKSR